LEGGDRIHTLEVEVYESRSIGRVGAEASHRYLDRLRVKSLQSRRRQVLTARNKYEIFVQIVSEPLVADWMALEITARLARVYEVHDIAHALSLRVAPADCHTKSPSGHGLSRYHMTMDVTITI